MHTKLLTRKSAAMLCTTALFGFSTGTTWASAQSYNSSGDNGTVTNDCGIETWASGQCSTALVQPMQNVINGSSTPTYPTLGNSGAIIGVSSVGNVSVDGLSGTSRRLYLGYNSASSGSFSLLNGGQWTTDQAAVVGLKGSGELNVSGVGTGANGAILPSRFSATNNDLIIGLNGSGVVNVTDGGCPSSYKLRLVRLLKNGDFGSVYGLI